MFMWHPGRTHTTAEPIELEIAEPLTTRWRAPGTCGEFVQGRLDGVDYLVNSPIDRFSTARLRPSRVSGLAAATPDRHSKVARLLAILGAKDPACDGMEIAIDSDLPHGKGMASSTADLIAAAGAAFDHLGLNPSIAEIAQTLVTIEPSDCTHVPGVGHVGQLCGRIFGSFRAPSALRVLVVDCGGIVDTVDFDRARAHHVYARSEPLVRTALSAALRGLATGDVALLARGATISARLSQQILFKEQFDDLLALAESLGALGVNCAHSGSVLGVLYRPAGDRGALIRDRVEQTFGHAVTIIGDHQFVSGGIYVDRR